MASNDPADHSLPKNQMELKLATSKSHEEDTEKMHEPNEKEEWIRKNIKMRKCSYYIASTKTDCESMCQCGYLKLSHCKEANDRPSQEQPSHTGTLKWKFEKHSTTAPTNAFGEIEFVGFIGNNAKFVRVDSKTEIDTLLKLMIDIWEIERPNLLISVIGGTDYFNMTPRLRSMFRSGLVDAARNKNAWIITEGIHVGVAKHVGEAVKYSRLISKNQKEIVAIGIASWGVIHDRQLLENKKSEPIQYTIVDKPNEHEMFLTPNHSHYILVDNGTQHKFETETALRTELEVKCKISLENDLKPVPVVLLVIDGGPRILKTIKNALSKSIPVVIVEGSGRVADLLAYAFKNAVESECVDKDKGNSIRKKKTLNLGQKHDVMEQMNTIQFCERTATEHCFQEIQACLDKFELINIFELGSSDQELYNTMLKAVLKATESDLVEQLRVALSMNLIDFARCDILTADKKWESGSLDDIMMSAILSHKVDFVELLLENAVSIKACLKTGGLLKLYNGELSSKSTFSTLLLNQRAKTNTEPTNPISMVDVGGLISYLLDDYYLEQYSSKKELRQYSYKFISVASMMKLFIINNPLLHLLIWAVLNNLQDMAKLFWRKGMKQQNTLSKSWQTFRNDDEWTSKIQDSIAAALLAHALLSAMKSQIKNASPNLYEDIEANSGEFMDLAAGVLNKCYRKNEKYTRDILIGILSEWETTSSILIAMKTKNETFISATACQEVFNNVWIGEMTQENSILKLLICMVIPPLIPLCIKFKEDKNNKPDADRKTSSVPVQEEAGAPSPKESLLSISSHKTNHGDERKYFRRAKEKIPLFYSAPIVNFLSHVISYMAFLCLYSYILISKFDQNFSVKDVILIVWLAHIFIDEINQVIATRHIYNEIKLKAYLADFWNIADILMILLFVIGIILKHLSYQQTLEAARVVLGVNLIICFLRLLQMFSLNKELGPKLVMIIRMVRNLTSFFVMLLIFIVAYAIASHAILYPDTEISFNVLRVIFRRPYWNIYGELMLDEIEGIVPRIEGTDDCTNIEELYRNGTQPRCPTESGKYVVPVLMGVYMLMCNILLLNLLISIFSNTFEEVQNNADKHWRIQRYHHIQDYLSRSTFLPLISLIKDVFHIIDFLKKYRRRCDPEHITPRKNVFLEDFDVETRLKLREWERNIAQDFVNTKQADIHSVDNSVQTITLRLDQLVSKIDALEIQRHRETATLENPRVFCSRKAESQTMDYEI